MAELSRIDLDDELLEVADEVARQSISNLRAQQEQTKQYVDEVNDKAETAQAIAKGRNQAHVFRTTEAMKAWLSKEENKGLYNVGDNIYIVDVGVPDWWVAEVLEEADADTGMYYKIAQLETQKVDLVPIEEEIDELNSNLESEHIYRTSLAINTNVATTNMTPFSYKGVSNALAEGIEILGVFVETPNSGDWLFCTSVNHDTRQVTLYANGNAVITCDVIYKKVNS